MLVPKPISGSVSVSFVVSGSDPVVSLEVDNRQGGYNTGFNGFKSNDAVGILLYSSPGSTVEIGSSTGQFVRGAPPGRTSRAREDVIEMLTFSRSFEAQLSKFPERILEVTPLGGLHSTPVRHGRTFRLPTNIDPPMAGVLKVRYIPRYEMCHLKNVVCPDNEPSVEVVCFAYGEGVITV